MVVSPLRRLALGSRPRLFCVAGPGGAEAARMLRLSGAVRIVSSPRAASLLVIVGELDPGLVAPALVAHDALARPRATVWWRLGSRSELVPANFPDAVAIDGADPVAAVTALHRDVVAGTRPDEPALLPDVEPAAWRGAGPYGQGGKGMTGGAPYGRPMAERADDRDGLKLDYLPVTVGPLFAPLPPGLALEVRLHGDVVAAVAVRSFVVTAARPQTVFERAVRARVPIAELELARARSHLEWLSDAMRTAGPQAAADKVLAVAARLTPQDADALRALQRSLRRRGYLTWNTRGVGVITPEDGAAATGPVARASGVAADVRTRDDGYQRLGFELVTGEDGDAAARWTQRIREAIQALELAARAGDAVAGGSGEIESPRGALTSRVRPSGALARLLPAVITGLEWGDAVAAVTSLDLDAAEIDADAGAGAAAS